MGKKFIHSDFLLSNKPARRLYHDYAEGMPIFDYHCHLPTKQIADNTVFDNLTQVWLYGDHYKWRAMRSNGVAENLCTGDASDKDKFKAWAHTVPHALRNPLYHWTHLELARYFGVDDRLLNPKTADGIYKECNEKLRTAKFSARKLIRRMNVKALCTTDDPTDSLEYHQAIAADGFATKVLPTFRPDKGMAIKDPTAFNAWVDRLAQVSDTPIQELDSFLTALRKRHDFFHEQGCRLSDHGVEMVYADEISLEEHARIFRHVRSGNPPSAEEVRRFQTAMMLEFGRMNHAKGWTMQIHYGAMRNNNTLMYQRLGADTGFDSIIDNSVAKPMSRFFDRLLQSDQLPRTVIYNLNPSDNEIIASMLGNFQDGTVPGKMQFGSGWWFLDNIDGMEAQMNALSNLGLLSRFIGMLTDSRSFLSYPRHEYFRRVLCNLLGNDMKQGRIPGDYDLVGRMVRDICYRNAVSYLGIGTDD